MKLSFYGLGMASSLFIFALMGSVTSLIPNPFFTRMVPSTMMDYIFLSLSSILMGAYIGVHFYKRNISKKCNAITYSGGIGSLLAFGCPICNKLLVILFGTTALMQYFEPMRPLLGYISIFLLSIALYWRIKK